jgi:hypothetical protein
LKADFDLNRGYGMAIVATFKGSKGSDKTKEAGKAKI